jgi:predicted DNA-binding transcriptional regulator YafY
MPFYTIKEAIRDGRRLKLSLADGEYQVEPHVLGRDRRGRTLLRAFQVRGPAPATTWKLFDLDNIQHAVELDERFEHPRQGYKANDPAMRGGILESF